ncbi:MAG: cytochrome c family protein [Hyphomicrobiales bacterium]|nr:MAG: cytochrome c family protein [Hyphomicrobiales bacterium]
MDSQNHDTKDPLAVNKIAGAVLGCTLFLFAISIVSDTIFHEEKAAPGFELAGGGADDHGGTTLSENKSEVQENILELLASADAGAGEKLFKKCKACHTVNDGGKSGTGPNLYNIVNRKAGAIDGFSYSNGMKTFGEDGSWDYASLDAFLKKPKAFIKKTKMGFGGFKKVQDRANMVVYLRSLAGSPVPLPTSE